MFLLYSVIYRLIDKIDVINLGKLKLKVWIYHIHFSTRSFLILLQENGQKVKQFYVAELPIFQIEIFLKYKFLAKLPLFD